MSKPTKNYSPPDHHDRRHLDVLLPAAILSLTAALSPEDIEVLAYLISYHNINYPSINNPNSDPHKKTNTDDVINADGDATHLPASGCNCFRCYTSFWSRCDASPNRDLIHEIIEKYEEGLTRKKSSTNNNKAKKRKKMSSKVFDDQSSIHEITVGGGGDGGSAPVVGGGDGGEGLPEKEAPVRRVMGFIREKIWGAWNI